jgi:uncharacterized protein with HEPN domain
MQMLEETKQISGFITGIDYNEFVDDMKTKYAVCMVLANLGELANKLTPEFRVEHNSIPWVAIRKTRNVIAHDYEQVNWSIIWNTASESIPALLPELEHLLRQYEVEEGPFDYEQNYQTNIDIIAQADDEFDEDNEGDHGK